MSNEPKRKPWQIHLSTAVVLMVEASALFGYGVAKVVKAYSWWHVLSPRDQAQINFGILAELVVYLIFSFVILFATKFICETFARRRKPPA